MIWASVSTPCAAGDNSRHARQFLAPGVGKSITVPEEQPLEDDQGRGGQAAGGGGEHGLQGLAEGLPVHEGVEPAEEVVGRGGGQEAVLQFELTIGSRAHGFLQSIHPAFYSIEDRSFAEVSFLISMKNCCHLRDGWNGNSSV